MALISYIGPINQISEIIYIKITMTAAIIVPRRFYFIKKICNLYGIIIHRHMIF